MNELLDTPNGLTIVIGVLCLIALLLCLLQMSNNLAINDFETNLGGTAGNIISLIVFLGVMIKLNQQTFDIQSFCLMNNNETICQKNLPLLGYNPENIKCSAIYNSATNDTSIVMVHYDGYSGFIKMNYSSGTDFKSCSYPNIRKYQVFLNQK